MLILKIKEHQQKGYCRLYKREVKIKQTIEEIDTHCTYLSKIKATVFKGLIIIEWIQCLAHFSGPYIVFVWC